MTLMFKRKCYNYFLNKVKTIGRSIDNLESNIRYKYAYKI